MASSRPDAIGFVEVPFLSITALVADAMVKAAEVHLLSIETTGNERLQIRVSGSTAAVQSAVAVAENRALELGTTATVHVLSNPTPAVESLLNSPNAVNPLYGGRDQFLPTDFPFSPESIMNGNQQALGILETQGLTAVLEATDVMLKTADVTLVGKEKIGAAYVTVIVRGDVAAVKAAIDAGAKSVGPLGKLIAAHVIARPHGDLISLLPK